MPNSSTGNLVNSGFLNKKDMKQIRDVATKERK